MTETDNEHNDHLAGKTVIITGAAGGFGQLTAERAASRGMHVIAADINEEGASSLADRISAGGGSAVGVRADVTRLGDMRAVADVAVERFGCIDAIVNNAGVMPLAFIADHQQASEAWDRCIDINIKGVLNGMIAVHDQMVSQGRGQVINISSIYGNHPVAGAAVYGATKAAVNMMSEAFRVETQGVIKVTVVKPTGVPGTGLGAGVINPAAITGILGQNTDTYLETMQAAMAGTADPAVLDAQDPRYAILAPDHIADAIIHVLDQPWGVSIGDITVRATGDAYIL